MFRAILPLSADHSIFDAALDDLVDAIRKCPMTRDEQRIICEFICHPKTHNWMFRTHSAQRGAGFHLVITLLPGYSKLLAALNSNVGAAIDLIRSEMASWNPPVEVV